MIEQSDTINPQFTCNSLLKFNYFMIPSLWKDVTRHLLADKYDKYAN